jgi:hypothetical protein
VNVLLSPMLTRRRHPLLDGTFSTRRQAALPVANAAAPIAGSADSIEILLWRSDDCTGITTLL